MGFDFTEGCGKILSFDRFLPTETRKLNVLYFKVVAFTMVNFRQYAIFFHYLLNIFGFLKRNNFLRKTDQCEHC